MLGSLGRSLLMVGLFGVALSGLVYSLDQRLKSQIRKELFLEPPVAYPPLPSTFSAEHIQISRWKPRRGDYLIEAHHPPFRPSQWTFNIYTKELIPWE